MGSHPSVVDWNNDAAPDLLVGDNVGYVYIFLNTGTNPDGTPILDSGARVQADGADLVVSGRAAAVYEDWDGDGHRDLMVGHLSGGIRLYLNSGDNTFAYSGDVQATGWAPVPYNYQSRSAPRFFDWDGDGLKDLLAGEVAGYVWYFRNVTEDPVNTPFAFDTAEKLLLEDGVTNVRYTLSGSPGPRSRISIADWDEDGLPDLLIGGDDGRLMLFLQCLDPVMIQDVTPYYYSSIQDAYDSTLDGDTIKIQGYIFTENLYIDRDVSVALSGGYNCSYADNSDTTALNGNMVVTKGSVTVMNLAVE